MSFNNVSHYALLHTLLPDKCLLVVLVQNMELAEERTKGKEAEQRASESKSQNSILPPAMAYAHHNDSPKPAQSPDPL